MDDPVIDTHLHVVNTLLPGSPGKKTPDGRSFEHLKEELADVLRREMDAANVVHALAMPQRNSSPDDPLGVRETLRLAERLPGRLSAIGFADPTRTDPGHLARVEEVLRGGKVVALKAYLGYLHHGPDSPGYTPYYRIAATFGIPVVFHTGDNHSHLAKLKYAHPLLIDEVAVDHPDVNFVLAHFGNPWMADAAEVVYKSNKCGLKENVWADLSGVVVGSAADFARYRERGELGALSDQIRKAFAYAERPDRFLFGTDWPLAPLAEYADFIRQAIPPEFHRAVLHDNALALFRFPGHDRAPRPPGKPEPQPPADTGQSQPVRPRPTLTPRSEVQPLGESPCDAGRS
jgi:predicted TIM-barrel fold metal-dependent hydrolase